MKKLEHKVAVVTGASKGIGAAIARALADEGAAVVVSYATSSDGAQKVVADIERSGGRALAVRCDVAKPADVEALFGATKEAFGRLDVVVNNAGVYKFQPLADFTEKEYRRQHDTNVLGLILVCKESLRHFGAEGGSIVNIGSNASRLTPPGSTIYTASKAAVDGVTGVLARELAPRKIRVNSINPGPTETEGAQALGIIGSDFEKHLVAQTPLGRLGQPRDIATVAVFLASSDAGWLTGEILTASGGLR